MASISSCPDGSIVAEATLGSVVFRPSRANVVRRVLALSVFAVAFPSLAVGFVWIDFREYTNFAVHLAGVGSLSLLVSGTAVAVAVRAWRDGAVPLVVAPDGRVLHGDRELYAAGVLGRLCVERLAGHGEGVDSDTFRVAASVPRGPLVAFPGPYFDDFSTWESAAWFATQLGVALGVPVDAKPLSWPTDLNKNEDPGSG